MINNVVMVGRLIRDCEVKKTQSNKSVCSFSLAVDKYANKQKKTDFFDFVVWEQGAEYLGKYGKKGNIVAVTGELENRDYTAKDGHKVRVTEIKCNRVQLLSVSKDIKETKIEEPSFFNRNDVDVSEEFKMPEWDDMPWNRE